MENLILGYELELCHPQVLTIPYIKEHLSKLEIEDISVDCYTVLDDKKIIYSDYEHPLVLVDAVLGMKTLSIDSKYYQEHREEIDELIMFICRNKKGDYISVSDGLLVNDKVYEAIGSNLNIESVRIGNYGEAVPLSLNGYNYLKQGNVSEIRSYAVCEELKDNFDPIILHNRRELVGSYTHEMLQDNDSFFLNNPLTDEEIYYLKYLNKTGKVNVQGLEASDCFKVVKRLKEVQHEGIINICVDNKNEFNNYLFSHLEELTDTQNIFIKSYKYAELDCDLLTYIKNERRLIEMVLPAMNLSPFEKYLFAYNKVKQYKKYKENNDDKTSARNIYQLLDNDYMVCVGFARLLGDLLEKLGIPSVDYSVGVDVGLDDIKDDTLVLPDKVVSSKDGKEHEVLTKRGDHARLEVHLVDPKYDIDGYFLADPTWDNDMKHDTYNYALMTQDEYIGIRRYNYFNRYGIDELFFIHSLEEFYDKINLLLNKNKNQKEGDIIKSLLNKFEELDKEFYQELISKYKGLDSISFDFTKENIQDIFLDMGEHILGKVNKMIDGQKFREGITVYYREIVGLTGEELEQKVNEVMEYNRKMQDIKFPTRYKIDRNEKKTVLFNGTNKFSIDSTGNLRM